MVQYTALVQPESAGNAGTNLPGNRSMNLPRIST